MTDGLKPRKRPKTLIGATHRIKTGCGNLYVTLTRDDQGLFEVFSALGKSGQCGMAQLEAICRCVSIGLRSGVDPTIFSKQLKGIRCPAPITSEGVDVLSCADAIATVLEEEVRSEVASNTTKKS